MASWTCSKCTFINDEGSDENDTCLMCQEPRYDESAANDNVSSAAVKGLCREKSIRLNFSSNPRRDKSGMISASDSIMALGNMSFAAWESDRKQWTCKACTFTNEPRFLVCGACGMAEGAVAVEDELIKSGLQRMSLPSAHAFLLKAVHKQLDSDREDNLRHERALELIQDLNEEDCACETSKREKEIAAVKVAKIADQKEGSAIDKAREHVESLERIQQAEEKELADMACTIEKWQVRLREEPNEEQHQEMVRQEALLNRLLEDWEDRGKELISLRMRVDGCMGEVAK